MPLTARALGAIAKQNGGTLSMRLDPPSLGDLRVTMTIDRGAVIADIVTSTRVAHDLLSGGLSGLREALERQGLLIDRITVHAPPAHAEGQAPSTSAGSHHAPSAQAGAAERSDARQEQRGDDRSGGQQSERRGDGRHDAGGGASRGRENAREQAHEQARDRSTATSGSRRPSFAQSLGPALSQPALTERRRTDFTHETRP